MELGFHKFPSGKQYVYIKPEDGCPIFLRNILFLKNASNPSQIALVREWGAKTNNGTWEPPKGQMEWKEFATDADVKPFSKVSPAVLRRHMKAGMMREMMEEAKIFPSEIRDLKMLPFRYIQDWHVPGMRCAKFMYQYWEAKTSQTTLLEAQKRIDFILKDKDNTMMVPADVKEKDAVRWWSPAAEGYGPIRGSFSKKMTVAYFKL